MIVFHAAETIKGGVATVINSLVDYQLKQSKIDQLICLVPTDQVDNLIAPSNLKVIQFQRNGRNLIGMLSFFWVFLKLIIEYKPDVVHLHSSFAALLGRLALIFSGRLGKTKVIYCPHAFGFLMKTSIFKKRVFGLVELILSKFTDKIICVSRSEYHSAIKYGFNKKKLVVIHNGVKIKSKLNKFTNKNKKNYKLLFVGRFDYQKGIDILSQAISLLCKDKEINLKYDFTLIGEAVNSESNIHFHQSENITVNQLGWLKPEDLEEQYLTHDALIIPSRWEGFAMVPLEAMSYGLPIMASNINAFREISNCSLNITLFELDPNSLYRCLINIENIDFKQQQLNSLNIIQENFTEDQMNLKTINLY